MYLDRGLIKQQARALISNRVMKLFLVSFIVSLCTGAVSVTYNVYYSYETYDSGYYFDDYYDDFSDFDDGSNDYGYFDDFGTDNGDSYDYRNDFYNFGAEIPAAAAVNSSVGTGVLLGSLSGIVFALSVLISPLSVAMAYFYVEFVTGKEYEFSAGLKSVFKNAFQVAYLKKIGAYLLKTIITYLLTLLFIVPGIIFSYSSYFTFEIISEYPEISPWQAVKLSKKIVSGHRTELFVLDLSFIPWLFLCAFIFPLIYVMPYMATTRALYYENFKLRALHTGAVTEDDFLSDAQKMNKYMYSQNGYGANQQNQQNPQNPQYNQQYGAQNSQYANPYAQNPPQGQYGANNYPYYNQQQGGAGYYGNPPQYQYGAQPYAPPAAPVYRPTYFTPDIPQQPYNKPGAQQNGGEPVDIYGNMANSAPGSGGEQQNAAPADDTPRPSVAESLPQEPQTPEFAEPQEPVESYVQPQEPADEAGPADENPQNGQDD